MASTPILPMISYPVRAEYMRRHVGRAVQKAEGIGREFDRTAFELKRRPVRHPAGGGRFEARPKIAANIQVARAGPATEPFDGAAGGKVEIHRPDVERQNPRRLIQIADHHRAHLMRASG